MLLLLTMTALAQSPPSRVVPPTVLAEVQELEGAFELALAADCPDGRCFSKGCAYVDHATADRGRARSMPGLSAEGSGPGSEPPQYFLTRASCAYAHEPEMEAEETGAINKRVQTKISTGWIQVSVSGQRLPELPAPAEPELPPEEPEVDEPAPPPPSRGDELWEALLPHFFWMLGIGLATLAAMSLIWGWRRLGRLSPEDQALLAELSRPEPEPAPEPTPAAVVEAPAESEWVAQQRDAWESRLAGGDPMLGALVRDLLRGEDRELLVQALLHFPQLAASFPETGGVAADKLELAALIRQAELSEHDEAAFFERLNRHALSAQLGAQADADTLRSLKQDFGASGLAELMGRVPPRIGGLLVALAPLETQLEAARLLDAETLEATAGQLLLSDRMDRDEAAWLFELLEATKTGELPASPAPTRVRDQGPVFDAAGALSTLLDGLSPDARSRLFTQAATRSGGALPAWYADILYADLLFALEDEARADLMLSVDVDALKAWIGALPEASRQALEATMPNALKATVMGPAPALDPARVQAGRRALARGFQRQLRRAGLPFEQAVQR